MKNQTYLALRTGAPPSRFFGRRTAALPALFLALAAFWAFPIRADEKLSDEVLAQIRALQQEKASRSAVHRKLDSQFVFELRRRRGQAIAPGLTGLRPQLRREKDDRVLVDIEAAVTQPLLDQIVRGGGSIVTSSPRFRSIRAQVRVEQLEDLAGAAGTTFIRPASPAMTQAGAITSDGDATHTAARARSHFGVTGKGLKIGVLSDGTGNLDNSKALGELGNVTVLPGQAGPSGSEGTAMLEILHDLAPEAELYFATAFNGEASFAENILSLRNQGCDIIVDDVFYFAESPFQDGIIAQAVNSATADGALYFSSAGNAGNIRYGTASVWEGNFVDGGQSMPGTGGKIHRFGLTNYNVILEGGLGVQLFWADPLGASTNDYDLFVLDGTGTNVLYASNNAQTGTQDPYEKIDYSYPYSRIVVVQSSGVPRYLRVQTLRGRLSTRTGGATYGHSAATNAISVAAVDALSSFPEPFNHTTTIETFSSDGPRRIFFHADGSPITPEDFSASGGQVRLKPDLTAADGVMTSVPGFQPFYGTSAAAPHAAAIAALLWSFHPSLSAAEVRAALINGALDIEAPGHDVNSGSGIVMAEAALGALPAKPMLVAGGIVLLQESCPNNTLDPGETVSIGLSITNLGLSGATNLVGTLLNTNGVILAGEAQSFGTIAARGGTATQTFSFVVARNCGETVAATLQLQDGPTALGSVHFNFRVGAPALRLAEHFDHLIPPALPAGWSSQSSGGGLGWRTTNSWSVSAYNSVFVSETGVVARAKILTLPSVVVTSTNAQFSFWQARSMDGNFGAVLDISANGGAYRDILDAGCRAASGGYNGRVWEGYSNSLEGRDVWTGSQESTFTQIILPASMAGQNVRFRFRFANGTSWSNPSSWFIDSIAFTDGDACCSAVANNLVFDSLSLPDSVVVGGTVGYRIRVRNPGPNEATGISVTNTSPAGFALLSVTNPPDVSVSSVGSNITVFTIPSLAAGDTRTMIISGSATASGMLTNRTSIVRSDGGSVSSSEATARTTVFVPLARINDISVMEGDSGTTEAIFTVSLTPPPMTNSSVRFATANQTALVGKDFIATNGLLTFAPGVTNQSLVVRIVGNLFNEPSRTFAVNLSSPTNLVFSRAQGIGTIVSEDPLPYVTVTDATVVKPAFGIANALFRFGLSVPSGQSVTVDYRTVAGSALEDIDYRYLANSLTFPPGQTNLSVSVVITNHITVKPSQTFTLALANPQNGKLARSNAVGTIVTALPGRLDHFSWELSPAPRSNGLPISATITARDFFEDLATNFSGSATLSAFSTSAFRTNTFFQDSEGSWWGALSGTHGYSFTPKTNMWVTHFRLHTFSESKVSLWQEDGTLLAQESGLVTNGTWVEKSLAAPVSLAAGRTYRLGAYIAGGIGSYIFAPKFDAPEVAFGQNYSAAGDAFPTAVDFIRFAVDFRYKVGIPSPLPLTPTNTGSFSNSAWTGAVTVQLPVTNVTLLARESTGIQGYSETFNVTPAPGQITHFAWEPMAALQPISNAFAARFTAMDYFNQPVSNYAGAATLSASFVTPGSRTNNIFGGLVHDAIYPDPNTTFGYSFTPKTNLTVTHFRSYFGSKVSLWTDTGTLLASRNVVGPATVWTETALVSPIPLSAGQTYRISLYATTQHYYRGSVSTNLADVLLKESFNGYGDVFPQSLNSGFWELADIRYTVAFQTTTAVAINPTNASEFTNGAWAGGVSVNRLATNLTLRADDRLGHVGLSQAFNVGFIPGLLERFVWRKVPSPQTNGAPISVSLTAVDHFNNPVTNFNGPVALAAQSGVTTLNLSPNLAGEFQQGVWTGSLSIFPTANGVVLRAADQENHLGSSEPFDLVEAPPASPRMRSPLLTTGEIELSWSSVPGRTYQIQYCTNLSQITWIEIDPALTATSTNSIWRGPVEANQQRFYRIQIVP